jgi:translation initiation factor 2 subunit 3
MGCKDLVVVQNKIDLVNEMRAAENYEEIRSFMATCMGSRERAAAVPVIPCAAISEYNMDVLLEHLAKLPVPPRFENEPPQMIIIRSFDVNHPGTEIDDLLGGVAGGSLLRGQLQLGQEIEIRPGLVSQYVDAKSKKKILKVKPLRTTVRALFSDKNPLKKAVPGGLIAVGTGLDPTLTTKDRLVGHVLGLQGRLPDVYLKFEMSYALLKRAVATPGSKPPGSEGSSSSSGDQKKRRADRAPKLTRGEKLQLNINSRRTLATIVATKADLVKVELDFPCCIAPGQRISICRKVAHTYRLSGIGIFQCGTPMKLEEE